MATVRVQMVGTFFAEAGSRWIDAVDEATAWAGTHGIEAVEISTPGCSVDHTVVPLRFTKRFDVPSEAEAEATARAWARTQPLMVRSVASEESA